MGNNEAPQAIAAEERKIVPVTSSSPLVIGDAVRLERETQDLTTTELAKRVGISQAQISRLENGKQGFRSGTTEKVARALGVILRVDFGRMTRPAEIARTDGNE